MTEGTEGHSTVGIDRQAEYVAQQRQAIRWTWNVVVSSADFQVVEKPIFQSKGEEKKQDGDN